MKHRLLFMFALLCVDAQGVWATTIDLGTVTADVTANDGDVLTGTTTTYKVTIAGGATVTLSGVNIDQGNYAENVYCIQCEGDATIILKDGTTNSLNCRGVKSTALRAGGSGTTLTIKGEGESGVGTGALTAVSGYQSAGIGGVDGTICGNIEIKGGIIEAFGGGGSAGIGNGHDGTCGNITITNGVTKVSVRKGDSAPYGIGKGSGTTGTCGTVTIGGIVYYNGSAYQYHGADYISRNGLTIASVNKAAVTVPASEYYLVIGDGNETSNQITLGTSSKAVLSNVNISNLDYCLKCEGDATVILTDGMTNTLTSTGNSYPTHAYPALWVGDAGTTTTIQGTGNLVAKGGLCCAAIGGGLHNTSNTCGNIRIEGGIIDATGGDNAVAIGADYAPDGETQCGNITITNDVTYLIAKGSEGEGIDCIGRNANGSCGTITIGGVVYTSDDDYIGQHALYFLKGNGDGTCKYWTTYYDRETNLLASEGTQVFKAGLSGEALTLTPISDRIINRYQGVILKSSSDHFLLATRTNESSDSYEGNDLHGTSTKITNPGNAYVLNKKNNVVGFYKLSATGTIGANKAYLTYSGASAREFFSFDEATGIDNVNREPITNNRYYDLQGRKVAQPSKGLYIKDGKKYIKM